MLDARGNNVVDLTRKKMKRGRFITVLIDVGSDSMRVVSHVVEGCCVMPSFTVLPWFSGVTSN